MTDPKVRMAGVWQELTGIGWQMTGMANVEK